MRNRLPDFKTSLESNFGKSGVFETGPCNLAGAGFETGVAERALGMNHWQYWSKRWLHQDSGGVVSSYNRQLWFDCNRGSVNRATCHSDGVCRLSPHRVTFSSQNAYKTPLNGLITGPTVLPELPNDVVSIYKSSHFLNLASMTGPNGKQ